MEAIIAHPNYRDMPCTRRKDGSIVWVAAKTSDIGKSRLEWWEGKKKPGESLRDVAFRLHPTKTHVCQICGREMELDYVYPCFNRLNRIVLVMRNEGSLTPEVETFLKNRETGLTHIRDVAHKLATLGAQPAMGAFAVAFAVPHNVPRCASAMVNYLLSLPIANRKNKLSPGAMSNVPDRLDGFHSYNLCCRQLHDRGRSPKNLSKYGEDRRAYEFWVDGDHKAASWTMREFSRYGWSADHIGPISQGFAHRPNGFRPTTKEFQSTRRDRLRAKDVALLLETEKEGECVASWHVRVLWNALKQWAVGSDERAEALGHAMRAQVHDTLTLLSHLLEAGHERFLRRLRRDLFKNQLIRIKSVEIEPGLNIEEVKREVDEELRASGEYRRALRVHVGFSERPLRSENRRSAYRVLKKSIDALRNYASATVEAVGSNRRLPTLSKEDVARLLNPVLEALQAKNYEAAEGKLHEVVDHLAKQQAKQLSEAWGCDFTQSAGS